MVQFFQKYSKSILLLLKLVVVLAAFYGIYSKISLNNSLESLVFLDDFNFIQLILISFLMLIVSAFNWIFEFYKWKNLVSLINKITFFEAMKQSLAAHTAAFLTPFKAGEFGVKALYFERKNTSKILYLSFLGNTSQLLMTLFFGFIGFYFYQVSLLAVFEKNIDQSLMLIFLSGLFIIVLGFGYFWLRSKFDFLKQIPIKIHLQNNLWAMLRYLLFSHQWLFLLLLLNPSLDYLSTISAVFSMYLLASIIPTLAIFDWAIKGSIAVYLFGLLGFQASEIVFISLLMWIYNFAIPALLGSYFIVTFPQNRSLIND